MRKPGGHRKSPRSEGQCVCEKKSHTAFLRATQLLDVSVHCSCKLHGLKAVNFLAFYFLNSKVGFSSD